jgi:hypothetical protein
VYAHILVGDVCVITRISLRDRRVATQSGRLPRALKRRNARDSLLRVTDIHPNHNAGYLCGPDGHLVEVVCHSAK